MKLLLCITIGILYSAAVYLLFQRSFLKLIVGIILFGHATNLFLLLMGRLTSGLPALLGNGGDRAEMADPFPQALILTAIVIGFGMQAFAIVLLKKSYSEVKTDDLDDINTTDYLSDSNKKFKA